MTVETAHRRDPPHDRALRFEALVDAPREGVWTAWTTRAGLETWFARTCHVDLAPHGRLAILFTPDEPPGRRGAEDERVLAWREPSFLSFTWGNPPSLPTIRDHHALVTVHLGALEGDRTLLRLVHGGFGLGEDWDESFMYFDRAWGEVVIPRLQGRFREGPVDWDAWAEGRT